MTAELLSFEDRMREKRTQEHPVACSLLLEVLETVPSLRPYLLELFKKDVQTFKDFSRFTEHEFFQLFPTSEENKETIHRLLDGYRFCFKRPVHPPTSRNLRVVDVSHLSFR